MSILSFWVRKDDFLKNIQKNQGIITARSSLPILSNVLLKAGNNLEMMTTNLDISILTRTKAEIKEKGSICLPVKKLMSFIREMPEEVINLKAEDDLSTFIKSGNCEFKIAGISSREFPSFPELKEAEVVTLNSQKISKMINLTSYSASTDEVNYILNGVLIEFIERKIKFIATDGRRLSVSEEELDDKISFKEKKSFVVPLTTIREIERNITEPQEVKLSFSENQMMFDAPGVKIVSRLLEGKFPDYQQVIPKESPQKLKIDRRLFLESLKRANLLSTLDYQAVELHLKEKELIIKKQTPDVGEMKEVLPCEFNGRPLTIGFNPLYFIEVLKNLEEEELEIEITDPEKPAVLRLKDFLYIVVPIRMV